MTIKIGVPSKGRLRKDVLKIFKKNKYNLISARGERDYFAKIKNKANLEIIYLHAREIIERLGDSSLDIGFSGYDLLKEAFQNAQRDSYYGTDEGSLVEYLGKPVRIVSGSELNMKITHKEDLIIGKSLLLDVK